MPKDGGGGQLQGVLDVGYQYRLLAVGVHQGDLVIVVVDVDVVHLLRQKCPLWRAVKNGGNDKMSKIKQSMLKHNEFKIEKGFIK